MKKYIYISLTVFLVSALAFPNFVYTQIFPDPDGGYGTFSAKKKEIPACDDEATAGIKKQKSNTSNRRYKFDIAFWPECYTDGVKKDGCPTSTSCNSGWNKAGRIAFWRANDPNRNKLHLGWRYHPKKENQLKLSAYFHETYNAALDYCFVSHYISTQSTDQYFSVDMFLGLEIIALIVENKALGIRKPGWIPKKYSSFLMRSFYFGEEDKPKLCVAPHNLACRFQNESYDRPNYLGYFNNCDTMVWNITTFDEDDVAGFFAFDEVHGSVKDEGDVEYHSSHPNQVKQDCTIENGADITFAAGKKVVLHPGFHAKPGSHFIAKIDPCYLWPSMGNLPNSANLTGSGYQVCYTDIFNADYYSFSLYKNDDLKFSESGSLSSMSLCFKIGVVWPGIYTAHLVLSNDCEKELVVPPHDILFLVQNDSLNIVGDSVQVFQKNKRGFDSSIVTENGVHDQEPNISVFSIYPNPNPGQFTLLFNDSENSSYDIEIINMIGESVYKNQDVKTGNTAIDLRQQPRGIYFVKVLDKGKMFTDKVVIK